MMNFDAKYGIDGVNVFVDTNLDEMKHESIVR